MGSLTLITGGARSGKSSYAEERAMCLGERILYIATAIGFDEEMKERIRRHRLRRPSSWATLEAFRDFGSALPAMMEGLDGVLLDCMTIMVSNIMLAENIDWENTGTDDINLVENRVMSQVDDLIKVIKDYDVPFIIVTNELGMGLVPPYALGRAMRDIAGRVNQKLAKSADEVYLCVSGIPVKIK